MAASGRGASPLYLGVREWLREQVQHGVYAVGSRIPSESELAAMFGVNRLTIRQAVDGLIQDGLLERRQGSGTYVVPPRRPSDDIAAAGHRIGMVAPATHGLHELLAGADRALRSAGATLAFASSEQQPDLEAHQIQRLVADGAHGLLIYPVGWSVATATPPTALVRLQRAEYPLVTFDGRLPGLACDSVTTDNFGAAYAATRHLLDLGHRRVALVTRPHTRTSSLRDRRLGYEAALRAAGLVPTPDLLLSCADRGLHAPTGALGAALQAARPTAALALGSWLAAEVVVSMRALGLRAPDDLALVAFDVGTLGAVLDPALTSVEQPAASMGEHAARLLLERLAGWRGPGRQMLLPARLLIRGSCGGSVGTRLLEAVPSGT